MLTTYKNILYIVWWVQNFYYNLLQKAPVIEEKKYKSFYLQLNQIVPVRFSKI